MEESKRLHELLEKQKSFINEYENILSKIDSNDIVKENQNLKQEVENYKKVIEDIKKENKELSKDNFGLKTALQEQILDEKLSILKISREKLNLYFKSLSEEYSNGLLQIEGQAKQEIERLRNTAFKEMLDTNDQFYSDLDRLKEELQFKISLKKDSFNGERQKFYAEVDQKVEHYSNQEVDQELIEKIRKRNNFEIKIGLNLINKIGILLVLLGVAYAFKYSYTAWFTPTVKGIFGFVIGTLFLVAGEVLYQKGKDIFAKGLIGGGIGILYFATFHSYFNLELIGMFSALGICVLIALVTLALSLRYNSQTIGSFALVGGFLPFFTYASQFGVSTDEIVYVMGYLFLLNVLLLLISIFKGWNVIKYISFILNIPSLLYLLDETDILAHQIIYSVITFGMYLIITLVYPFRKKIELVLGDIILLGLNTFISCLLIYQIFIENNLSKYNGALALGFCLIYFALAQFVTRFLKEERVTQGIFYLTALTFAVLIIPFQFSWRWVVVGWIIEGSLLTIYGLKNKLRSSEISGWVIIGLCTFAFYLNCLLQLFESPNIHFDIKFITFIVGIIAILFTYLIEMKDDILSKHSYKGFFINFFKYFTIINFWIYLIYISNRVFDLYVKYTLGYYDDFYRTLLFALITIITAFIITNIKLLYDKVVRVFSIIMYILADLILFFMTWSFYPLYGAEYEIMRNVSIAILIVFNVFTLFNIRWITIGLLKGFNGNLEIYPLVIGIYFIFILNGMLITQFDLGNENLLFSIIYVVLAFTYIVYGFFRNYVYIRRFGLGLALFATAKLFIYDLSYLEIGGKIIAYFACGFTLIAISFIYQKLKNNLEVLNKNQEIV